MVFYTKIVMRLLLFLQRVTFICNLLFILCLVIIFTHNFISSRDVQNYAIILGIVVSFILTLVVNVWEFFLLFNRKISIVPNWLRIFNLILLVTQLSYRFFI